MQKRIAGSLLCLAGLLWGIELPSGTQIEIRVKNKLSSTTSRPHDLLEAVVIKPVMVDDKFAIPAGAMLGGQVENVVASTAATDQRAVLDLKFTSLVAGGGKTRRIAARLVGVDNARESVDDSGKILGILGSETLSSQMDQGLEKLGKRSAGLAEILQIAKGAIIKSTDTEISYEPGVEMTLQLTGKLDLGNDTIPGVDIQLEPVASETRLQELAGSQPFQTIAEKPPKPSDITNLMLIGARQQIEAAFKAAGWTSAAGLSKQSGLETFRAIAEARGYSEAPMSVLLLDQQKPDLSLQKQNNTFAARHHLRIWHRPAQWQGRDVWVSAATHDIGIDFSQENRTFIHKIDSRIDDERAKVVSDLLLTQMVKSLALVDRPDVPKQSQNATGDNIETDGRLAVIIFR